jgi:hypothetical protein
LVSKNLVSKYVTIRIKVPRKHYEVIQKVSALLECAPETVFQKSLNHALKTNTLGHVVETMLGDKYRDVFNNQHDLDL